MTVTEGEGSGGRPRRTRRLSVTNAVLAAVVVVLATALVVILVQDNRDDDVSAGVDGSPYIGMAQAMGSMDSDAMLARMREVLGEEAYQQMMQHLREHRSGAMMGSYAGVDGMMHQLMDGIMQQMPDDRNHMLPRSPMMPSATGTATPLR